jgi:hypothetical protein
VYLKLAAAAATLAVATGCIIPGSSEQCTLGSSPFDGESGVARDRPVELRASAPLPRGLPPLDAVFDVFTTDGEQVAVDVDLSADRRHLTVSPRSRWPADSDVELVGPRWSELDATPHWSDHPPEQGWAADLGFHTGPALRVRGLLSGGPGVLRLVTSEPVDLDTLDGRVRLADDHSGRYDFEVLGRLDGLPHVAELAVPLGVSDGRHRVFVSRGVTAESGVQLPADVVLGADFGEEEPLVGFAGEPTCDAVLFL